MLGALRDRMCAGPVAAELAATSDELARRQGFTDALLETIGVGIVSCDAAGTFVVNNRAERELFGLEGSVAGDPMHSLETRIDVFDGDGRRLEPHDYPLMRALRGEDISDLEVLAGPAGGPHRELLVRARRITGPDGGVLGAVAALNDVTAERTAGRRLVDEHQRLAEAQREAQEANAFLSAVLSASPDFTFVADLRTGELIYLSPGGAPMGIDRATLTGGGFESIVSSAHPEDRPGLLDTVAAVAGIDDGRTVQTQARVAGGPGGWRWLSHRMTPFRRDGEGRVVEILAVVRDVTDVMEAQQRLVHAAGHDYLTGLPNRARLVDRLDRALGDAAALGRDMAVLFCDLNGFKTVNDTGGHAAGDRVLAETARRVVEVVGDTEAVARVGGDEFLVIVEPWTHQMPGCPAPSTPELAAGMAARIGEAIGRPIAVDGRSYVVTASIGIACAAPEPGRPGSLHQAAESLLHQADAAMYRAKDRSVPGRPGTALAPPASPVKPGPGTPRGGASR